MTTRLFYSILEVRLSPSLQGKFSLFVLRWFSEYSPTPPSRMAPPPGFPMPPPGLFGPNGPPPGMLGPNGLPLPPFPLPNGPPMLGPNGLPLPPMPLGPNGLPLSLPPGFPAPPPNLLANPNGPPMGLPAPPPKEEKKVLPKLGEIVLKQENVVKKGTLLIWEDPDYTPVSTFLLELVC